MKKVLSIFLTLLMVVSILPFGSLTTYALDSRVEKAIEWAISIANDNSHGYNGTNRNGPDYDCSSFVSTAFKNGGFSVSGSLGTGNMLNAFISAGFTKYNKGAVSLQRGDILLRPKTSSRGGHTEIYLGNNQCVAAHSDKDGKSGDSSGKEIEVRNKNGCEFCRDSDYTYILRYEGSSQGNNTPANPYSSTNPDDYTYPNRTLKQTTPVMEGKDVAWVQAVLKKLGYSITIDGKYGPNTVNIIKQFQSAYGLTVDGYCGPKTREKLLSLWNTKKHITHNYTWKSTTVATCTQTGKKVYQCSCGASYTETIAALGHNFPEYWVVDKVATCTQTGSKHRSCTRCGVTAYAVSPTKQHTASNWITDKNSTCTQNGSKHKECTECGEVLETATIPQLKPVTPKVTTTNEIGGVNVTWNKVDGAVKYNVYRRQGGYNTWTLVGTTTGNTLLDKNVKSGIYYVYSVRAYNNVGQYSDFVSANTQTRKFMATPNLTTIYNHVNGLAIKWNAVAGVTNGYRVYRRGAGSTYWTYLGTTKNLYFIDSQVKNKSGEYFRYTVIADGDYHSKFDTTGLYLKRLANPTLTSAVSSKSGITVKWGAIKGTTGYYVYRKTANSTWTCVGTVGGTNNTTFLDKTAKKGTTYTYTVKAVYGATTSAYNAGISCKDKY